MSRHAGTQHAQAFLLLAKGNPLLASDRPRARWRPPAGAALLLLIVVVIASGCGRGISTQYGKSRGRSGTESINGLGTLRTGFEINGWRTRDVHRLGDRLRFLDTILWAPESLYGARPDTEAIYWFQQWLNDRPRTLIYVLPDAGSEVDYWQQAQGLAPPEQRVEYQRRYARALAHSLTQPAGDLSTVDLAWFEAQRRNGRSPQWDVYPGSTEAGTRSSKGGGSSPKPFKLGPQGVLSRAEIFEGAEYIEVEPLRYDNLVVADDAAPLVMRIRFAQDDGGDGQTPGAGSQILVVAGGSLVTNFALTQPQGREVAQVLLSHSGQSGDDATRRMGFLLSGPRGVPVSSPDEEPPTGSGMALLALWPLSLVSMHLALMGIVACLILLPIFGRPRRLRQVSQSDFADHIHAVAALMYRSGGETFARSRISDYMRRVRGETVGSWVLPEPPSQPPPPHSHKTRAAVQTAAAVPPVAAVQSQEPASEPEGTLADQPQLPRHEPRR